MPYRLSILVWVPAAAAVAVAILDGRRAQLIRGIARTSAIISIAVAAPLWFAYEPRGAEWQFVERVEGLPSIGASYLLGMDGFGLAVVLAAAAVGLAVMIGTSNRTKKWHVGVLASQSALFGVLLSLDLLLWLVFAIVALVAGTLVAHSTSSQGRHVRRVWALTFAAAAIFTAAVFLLYASHSSVSGISSFDLRLLRQTPPLPPAEAWIFAAFGCGFALAAAQLRGHLPSVIVLLYVAAFAFIRINLPVLPDASRAFGGALMMLAVAGAMATAILAFVQRTWWGLAAYACFTQMAVAIAGASSFTPDGLTGSMVLASVPAFGGLVGAWLALEGIWGVSRLLAVPAAASVALVVMAILVMCWRAYRGHEAVEQEAVVARSVGIRELLGQVALAALAVGVGLAPVPLLSRVETSVARVVLRVSPQYAPEVADCLAQPPPAPAETGLPPGVVMSAPCADGSQPGDAQKKGR